jgi:energy-converting hydrogenase Eha subunit C
MDVIILGPSGLSYLDYFMYSLFFLAVFTIIFIVGYMVGRYR